MVVAGLDRSGDSVVNTASRDLGEVGSMVSRPPSLRIIASLWRLTQADTGATAVSSMNSTPANSKARRTARSLAAVVDVSPSASCWPLICSGCCVVDDRLDLVELFADLALCDFDIITVLQIQP